MNAPKDPKDEFIFLLAMVGFIILILLVVRWSSDPQW